MPATTEPDTTEHETDQPETLGTETETPETIGTETETPEHPGDTPDQGDGDTAEPTDVVGALVAA
ncbi:hypothetical protein [Streptomyces lydicus]|uniref:hypothetical protein n=1 Tax=Streptomyces lydicus TaxID=47763 RepID=UPI0010121787|nr:hypothetical protein [Streptomyces lydicus]MCZ1009426.1 hypothetical protein [Streptomyces lydicus]